MANKKVATLLIAVLTVSGLLAHRDCYDRNGNPIRCRRGVVRHTGDFVEDTTIGAGETAANILTLGGFGRARRERRAEEREREEENEDMDEEEINR